MPRKTAAYVPNFVIIYINLIISMPLHGLMVVSHPLNQQGAHPFNQSVYGQ